MRKALQGYEGHGQAMRLRIRRRWRRCCCELAIRQFHTAGLGPRQYDDATFAACMPRATRRDHSNSGYAFTGQKTGTSGTNARVSASTSG